jgi:hypothetical protein
MDQPALIPGVCCLGQGFGKLLELLCRVGSTECLWPGHATPQVISQLAPGDRPEPAAEAIAWPVAAEIANVRQDGSEHLLHDIRRVTVLKS